MRHLACSSVIRGEDIAASAVLFGVFNNLLDIGIFITDLWLIYDLKYTIDITLASGHHVETCYLLV